MAERDTKSHSQRGQEASPQAGPLTREKTATPKHFSLYAIEHSADRADRLIALAAEARDILDNNPGKKIIIFTEDAGGIQNISREVTSLVLRGVPPSEAAIKAPKIIVNKLLAYAEDHPEEFDAEPLKRFKEAAKVSGPPPLNRFMQATEDLLDDLADEYPARIVWMGEWIDDETRELLQQQAREERSVGLWAKISRALEFESRDKRIARERAQYEMEAKIDQRREQTSARALAEALDDDDIVGGVGWMGAEHTSLGHELHRDGHDVTFRFPVRHEGSYYYTAQAAVRRAIKAGKEVTDEDIALAGRADDYVKSTRGLLLTLDNRIGAITGSRIFYRGERASRKEQKLHERAHRWMAKMKGTDVLRESQQQTADTVSTTARQEQEDREPEERPTGRASELTIANPTINVRVEDERMGEEGVLVFEPAETSQNDRNTAHNQTEVTLILDNEQASVFDHDTGDREDRDNDPERDDHARD
jgi:hypothetical protein